MLNGRFHYNTLKVKMEDIIGKNTDFFAIFGVFHKKELPDNGSS
jgi:hypothetical protein